MGKGPGVDYLVAVCVHDFDGLTGLDVGCCTLASRGCLQGGRYFWR